jgi:hypothetical protein
MFIDSRDAAWHFESGANVHCQPLEAVKARAMARAWPVVKKWKLSSCFRVITR